VTSAAFLAPTPADVATNASTAPPSQRAIPPRVSKNATNSPAAVVYVRTVDAARSAVRSHAWNRATASTPPPASLLMLRE
jgi:hypothetical protein